MKPLSLPPASPGTRGYRLSRVDRPTYAHREVFSYPFPTTRRSILLINSALRASASFMSLVVCFMVLVFDPRTPFLR
jgi:hypothetical protein